MANVKQHTPLALKQLPSLKLAILSDSSKLPLVHKYNLTLDFLQSLYSAVALDGGGSSLSCTASFDVESLSELLDLGNIASDEEESFMLPRELCSLALLRLFSALLYGLSKTSKIWSLFKKAGVLPRLLALATGAYKRESSLVLPSRFTAIWFARNKASVDPLSGNETALLSLLQSHSCVFILEAANLVNSMAAHTPKVGLLLRLQNFLVPLLDTVQCLYDRWNSAGQTKFRGAVSACLECTMGALLLACKSELNCKIILEHGAFTLLVRELFGSASGPSSKAQVGASFSIQRRALQICKAMLKFDRAAKMLTANLGAPALITLVEGTLTSLQKSCAVVGKGSAAVSNTSERERNALALTELLTSVCAFEQTSEGGVSPGILKRLTSLLKRQVSHLKDLSEKTSSSLGLEGSALNKANGNARPSSESIKGSSKSPSGRMIKKPSGEAILAALQCCVLTALPCCPLPFSAELNKLQAIYAGVIERQLPALAAQSTENREIYKELIAKLAKFYAEAAVPKNLSLQGIDEPSDEKLIEQAMRDLKMDSSIDSDRQPLKVTSQFAKADAVLKVSESVLDKLDSRGLIADACGEQGEPSKPSLLYWKCKRTLCGVNVDYSEYSDILSGLSMEEPRELEFSGEFEGGNLQAAYKVAPGEYNLILENDVRTQSGTYGQWFCFYVKNKAITKARFSVINMAKPKSQFNSGMQPVVYSEKIKRWMRMGSDVVYIRNQYRRTPIPPEAADRRCSPARGDSNCDKPHDKRSAKRQAPFFSTLSFTIEFPEAFDRVLVAYHYPYTANFLQRELLYFEDSVPEGVCFFRAPLCKSLSLQHLVEVITVTDISEYSLATTPLEQRPVVVFTGRVHPGESNASFVMDGILRQLVNYESVRDSLLSSFVFHVIPMLNPDGVTEGHHRCSLLGRDLNREWAEPDPLQCPEIFYCKQLLHWLIEFGRVPSLFCDFHGHSLKKGVFLYGCPDSKLIKVSRSAESRSQPDETRSLSQSNSMSSAHSLKHSATRLNRSSAASVKSIDSAKLLPLAKLLPELLYQGHPLFSLDSTTFNVGVGKESTARIVLWRPPFSIPLCYTCESTFCGGNREGAQGFQVDPSQLVEFGQFFVKTLLDKAVSGLLKQLAFRRDSNEELYKDFEALSLVSCEAGQGESGKSSDEEESHSGDD